MEEKEEKELVVDEETAIKDFDRFVEFLKISPRKLEKMEEEKEEVIRGIRHGNITVDDEGRIKCHLEDALTFEGGKTIDTISFMDRRVTVGEMESKMLGKSDLEKTRRMFAFITKENSGIFTKMGDDFMLISQVAAFFLPR